MGATRWSVRKAHVDDAPEVAAMLHAFNTEFDTPSPGTSVLAERLRTLLTSPTTFVLLSGTPASAFALVTLRSNVWYDGPVATLDELYVAPKQRSQGIGSALMGALLREAQLLKVGSIEINVDAADVDAQRFYVRNGYSGVEPETGERAYYFFRELAGQPTTIDRVR